MSFLDKRYIREEGESWLGARAIYRRQALDIRATGGWRRRLPDVRNRERKVWLRASWWLTAPTRELTPAAAEWPASTPLASVPLVSLGDATLLEVSWEANCSHQECSRGKDE